MKFRYRNQLQPSPRQRMSTAGHTPVYSYYARRSQEQSIVGRQVFREATSSAREAAAKAAHFSRRRLATLAVLIALLAAVANLLWLMPDPKVLPLNAKPATFLHDLPTYQQAASRLFASSMLNRNKITVDTDGISAKLKQQYPELGVVSVVVPLVGHSPVVYIGPTALQLRLISQSGASYGIDENGRVLGHMDVSALALGLPPVQNDSDTPIAIGQLALSSDTVAFIRTIQFQMTQKQVRISRFILPAATSELDMYLQDEPYFVKFNIADNGVLEQVGTFLAVRHHLAGEGKQPSTYIDVRIPGRAYYK